MGQDASDAESHSQLPSNAMELRRYTTTEEIEIDDGSLLGYGDDDSPASSSSGWAIVVGVGTKLSSQSQ